MRHDIRVLFLFIVFLQQFQCLSYFPCRIMAATVRQQIQAYLDVGVTHFIIVLRRPGFYDRKGLRLFAKEMMPHFRKNP